MPVISTDSFPEQLTKIMKEKKQLSDSTIQAYLRNLRKLNGDAVYKNFNFLKDTESIQRKLDGYKENTKRNFLISIVSALSLINKPAVKKLHDKYYELMMKKSEQITADVDPNELTKTQEKNWISWDDVKKRYDELEKEVDSFYSNKTISDSEYNTLLAYTILSLYVHQAPRRNKDYQIMLLSNDTTIISKENNYLDLVKKEFVFNSYKTSNKYGTQVVPISDDLWKALQKYFKHHPNVTLLKTKIRVNAPSFFLVYPNKSALDKVNSITRILNKVFGKAIGSSMLRHIFITDKHGKNIEEQVKDAKEMAHSGGMQAQYVKKSKPITVSL
jgi:integrase